MWSALLTCMRPQNPLPPSPDQSDRRGKKNEIYNRENVVGPLLVHKLLGPNPPSPSKDALPEAYAP